MVDKKNPTRGKPRPTKDRVLQARIPEQLDDELRDRAEQLGLSVSTIVRNVLLHTFELVEGVVSDSAQVGRALRGGKAPSVPVKLESPTSRADDDPEVLGWQEAVLNLNGVCDQCNTILAKGQPAAVGVPKQKRPALLCLQCLATLSSQSHEAASAQAPTRKPRVGGKKSP
jgi:hypothetical protein